MDLHASVPHQLMLSLSASYRFSPPTLSPYTRLRVYYNRATLASLLLFEHSRLTLGWESFTLLSAWNVILSGVLKALFHTSFRSLLKCHLLSEALSDHHLENCKQWPPSIYIYSWSPFPVLFFFVDLFIISCFIFLPMNALFELYQRRASCIFAHCCIQVSGRYT